MNANEIKKNYMYVFMAVIACYNDSINSLEKEIPWLFNAYAHILKAIIIAEMNSEKQHIRKKENKASNNQDNKIAASNSSDNSKDSPSKANEDKAISNKDMVISLTKSGFMSYQDICDELLEHIILQNAYYFIAAKNASHSYNLIKVSIFHKLVDFTREMIRYDRLRNAMPIGALITNDDGEEILFEVEDKQTCTEISGLADYAKEIDIHENTAMFISTKKHDRMIAYLNHVAGNSNVSLQKEINQHGYSYALMNVISNLSEIDINMDYLTEHSFTFKIPAEKVTQHNVDTWLDRARLQIREKQQDVHKSR